MPACQCRLGWCWPPEKCAVQVTSVRRNGPICGSLSHPSSSNSQDVVPGAAYSGSTSAPIGAPPVSSSKPRPEFIRLPKPGQRDPYFSLSRSYWNLLVLPCELNGFKPPIKSISLRRPGTKFGVRLISYASAVAYFKIIEAANENGLAVFEEDEVR